MTAKQSLLELISALPEELAAQVLDYANLLLDPDEASKEDLEAVRVGRAAIRRGEGLDLEAVRQLLSE